ncbi:MAG: sugar lactone lactonase YvrE [Saprospiraceae bacterium]|jgi:sugar lactone lactonase YvrE
MQAEKVLHIPNTQLGEGPVWDYRNNILYWVDIMNGLLHGFDPKNGSHHSHKFDQYLGAAVPCEDGQFILAMQHGFALFNPITKKLQPIANPESDLPNNRFNDGKCDPAGRFWAGTMAMPGGPPTGSFYCLNNDLKVEKKLTNIHISNGLDWTTDGQKLYYIDTLTHKVQ